MESLCGCISEACDRFASLVLYLGICAGDVVACTVAYNVHWFGTMCFAAYSERNSKRENGCKGNEMSYRGTEDNWSLARFASVIGIRMGAAFLLSFSILRFFSLVCSLCYSFLLSSFHFFFYFHSSLCLLVLLYRLLCYFFSFFYIFLVFPFIFPLRSMP